MKNQKYYVPFYVADVEGRYRVFNKAAQREIGKSLSEALGKTVLELGSREHSRGIQ